MVVDSISTATLMNAGAPLLGGGILSFAMGYVLTKLLKLALIGVGLILAFIAFLEYKKWISVNWDIVQSQAGAFVQHSTQQVMDVVNNTARELGNTHAVVGAVVPILGITGFVPGLFLGLSRG